MQRDSSAKSRQSRGLAGPGKRLFRAWRGVATGLGFLLFGLLSLLRLFVISPAVRLRPGDQRTKVRRAQYSVHVLLRGYFRAMQATGACRIRCEGAERLREPGVFVVANHPTLIDALVLLSEMPQADLVVKDRYFQAPLLGGTARFADYISSSEGPRLVEACVDRLRDGRSLIMFPEATRSPTNGLGHFSRGTAHVALRAGCDVLPVTIRCEPATLNHDQHWWEVPDRPFELSLMVGERLVVKDLLTGDETGPGAARKLTSALRAHFEEQLALV
jgi:1-acyl-sn-glycerol-3-phosphate acyltransferase